MLPLIEPFFDPLTGTVSYVVYDRPGGRAAIVDPLLDYDAKSAQASSRSVRQVVQFVNQTGLTVDWILETHAHADHVTAAQVVKRQLGGKVAIGERIVDVQEAFKALLNLGSEFCFDGSQFDHLFAPDEVFRIGELSARALYVPGHTPADMAYQLGDAVFVGDTLFMPDVGTARCDFPGGDAHALYRSIQKLMALPPETRLFMCHDYPPANRSARWETSVGEQRRDNIHVRDGVDEAGFVAMRQTRDAGLEMPVLIWPSIQINVRAGNFPPAENNGQRYLKIPFSEPFVTTPLTQGE